MFDILAASPSSGEASGSVGGLAHYITTAGIITLEDAIEVLLGVEITDVMRQT